jgi:hypothetical protein
MDLFIDKPQISMQLTLSRRISADREPTKFQRVGSLVLAWRGWKNASTGEEYEEFHF